MPQTTSRKSAEQAAAGLDLSLLEASSVVAAVVVDVNGNIVGANARMRRFLGMSEARFGAGNLVDRMVDASAWRSWVDVPLEGRTVEVELRAFEGPPQMFRGDLTVHGTGARKRILGVLVEGDGGKALRAAAQHSARMEALGSLTAGVAHDFNNLLTVLVGNLYLIGEELRERPKVFEKLKAARDAGKRGTELIKQLMTFARREELEVGTVDPRKVIGDVLPLLRRALGSRIVLTTTLDQDVGFVRANVAQLESAIVNLAVNARDAIEGRGSITIEVSAANLTDAEAALNGLARGGRFVTISVQDTGSGIPADVLGKVFEPFFSTKRERGGTGLGLSMVRWFAQHAGGSARIDSVVGKGTTVTIWLPLEQPEQQVDATDMTMPLSTLPTGTERVVVLALDDALRSTMHQTLEVLGYRVRVASGAEDLLAAVAAEPTELLMVDGLGRGDADILIRARAVQPKLRIIATSDPGKSADRVGVTGIAPLAKPFTLADLAATVRRTLDAPAGL